jgi:hypothetical protein
MGAVKNREKRDRATRHYEPGDKIKSTAVKAAIVTAIIIYVIVSEGSRVFPPRNLVPVW